MKESIAPILEQEDENIMMSALAKKFNFSQPEKKEITTEPGTKLVKVAGISTYMQVPSSEPRHEKGKTYSIELSHGERLHRFEAIETKTYKGYIYATLLREIEEKNKEAKIIDMKSSTTEGISIEITTKSVHYVIQPEGSPNLNRKGAANLIGGISDIWVYKLIGRGPCHINGGLTGYVMAKDGSGWIPRRAGEPHHGAEIYLYKKDVDEYISAYPKPNKEDVQHIEVPAPVRELFVGFATPELKKVGYVTVTRVWAEAKDYTAGLNTPELKSLGLKKRLTDKDYGYLRAVVMQEGWKGHPRKSHSTDNSYRRNYRVLEDID